MAFIDAKARERGFEPIWRELAIAPSSCHDHAARLADQDGKFLSEGLGSAVQGAPLAAQVKLSDASQAPYDRLVIATGARAISLPVPGAQLQGVRFLRSASDVEC